MAKYHVIACRVLWRELCHFAAVSKNVVDFNFLEQGLHNTPDELTAQLQEQIDSAPDECDAILLGYGLCSTGLNGIKARSTRLVVMRGHDCITFLLGSKEMYREYFDSHPGTYWYSPGWIDTCAMPGKERYEKTLSEYREKYGDDNAEYLMEMEQDWMKKYSRATYVSLGFDDNTEHVDYTRKCAEWLKWECDVLQGDPGLIVNFIEGNWDSEDFLVVEPGETITASHDDRIVAIQGDV